MDIIKGLLTAAALIYISAHLEPGVTTTVATITTPTYSPEVMGLNRLIIPVLGIGIVWLVFKSMKQQDSG